MAKIGIQGDPESDPVAYLKELIQGETSINPEKIAKAYFKLAQETQGLEQLAYCALAWAVGSGRSDQALKTKIRELEKRIAALEARKGP